MPTLTGSRFGEAKLQAPALCEALLAVLQAPHQRTVRSVHGHRLTTGRKQERDGYTTGQTNRRYFLSADVPLLDLAGLRYTPQEPVQRYGGQGNPLPKKTRRALSYS